MHKPPSSDAHLEEQTLSSTRVYEGSFLKVNRDVVSLPDGKHATREYVLHPGAVVIVPVREDGMVLMERQFRYPLARTMIEFPAGKIDAGEVPLHTAQRELLEETGYTAQQWQHLCTIHNAIAYSNEHLEIYLAKDLKAGQAKLDDGEFLEIFWASPNQLLQWVHEGKITDVKTVIGIFWLEKYLAQQWC